MKPQIQEETYPVHLLLIEEEEGGYSAIALNLPGAGSCGDTKEQAIENAKEAVQGALESYKQEGIAIPWRDTTADQSPGVKIWIDVHA